MLLWKRLEGRSGHTAGRELLRQAYRELRGGEMPKIVLTDRGKPCFADCDLHFSISHTKKHAFCCLSAQNVGIDAEEMDRNISPALAEKLLSPGEKARLAATADKNAAFLRLWVLKEAYAKCTGRGVGNYLKNTDFSPEDSRIQIIDGCYVAVWKEETYAL